MNAGWRPLVVFALAGLALTASAPLPPQTPSFSTRVEAVRVDVLVTQGGRVVRGLGAPDFEIRDNGVLQQVDLVSFEQLPLNVILALDVSSSVAGERMVHLREAAFALLDALGGEDQAALVTFNEQVRLETRLTSDLSGIRHVLERTIPWGDTAVVDACFAAMVLGESDLGRSLLIVFSDGNDTSSWLTAERVIDTARRSDVVVYPVSAGRPRGVLGRISSETGGRLFEVESTRNLEQVFLRVLDEFRQRYLVSYSPRGVDKGGWHRLDVRVKGRDAQITARTGYQAGR